MNESKQRHEKRSSDDLVVAKVTVQVTDDVTNWEIDLLDNPSTLRAIIAQPEWCPMEWVVADDLQSAHDPRAYDLLLQKMRFVFDFGSPGGFNASDVDLEDRIALVLGDTKKNSDSVSEEILPIYVEGRLMRHGEMMVTMNYDRHGSIVGSATPDLIQQYAADSLRRELRLPSQNLQMRKKSDIK